MLYSQADWFSGSVATTNMASNRNSEQSIKALALYNCPEGWGISNFLSVLWNL